MRPPLDVYGITDRGKVRTENQDQILVAELRKEMVVHHDSLGPLAAWNRDAAAGGLGCTAYLLMVADGVGGVAGGAGASSMAVEIVAEHVARVLGCYFQGDHQAEDEFLVELRNAAAAAHEAVAGRHAGSGRTPGTTLTMVTVVWPRAYLLHVGDSRAYLLRDDGLRRLTRDQTMAEQMLDEGTLTEAEAATSRLQNVLISAIGGQIDPVVAVVDLEPGQVLMLCSDGLTRHVDDERIAAELAGGRSAKRICRRLIDLALEAGGTDNVAVVVARAS